MAHVRHGVKGRPAIENLEACNLGSLRDCDVNDFPRRQRLQVAALLFYRPRAIDGGVNAFGGDDGENRHDRGRIIRNGAPDSDA